MALKPKDKKVVAAFGDEKELDGDILSSEKISGVLSLRKAGLGGQVVAKYKNGKIDWVGKMADRTTQSIARFMIKDLWDDAWGKKPFESNENKGTQMKSTTGESEQEKLAKKYKSQKEFINAFLAIKKKHGYDINKLKNDTKLINFYKNIWNNVHKKHESTTMKIREKQVKQHEDKRKKLFEGISINDKFLGIAGLKKEEEITEGKFKLKMPKTEEEARDQAIQWQSEFASKQYSWEEVMEAYEYFVKVAKKFGLTDEFQENGII